MAQDLELAADLAQVPEVEGEQVLARVTVRVDRSGLACPAAEAAAPGRVRARVDMVLREAAHQEAPGAQEEAVLAGPAEEQALALAAGAAQVLEVRAAATVVSAVESEVAAEREPAEVCPVGVRLEPALEELAAAEQAGHRGNG